MAKLKAFIRFDGSGRIIPGTLIVQSIKPKVGNWREINSTECCDPNCDNPIYEHDQVIANVSTVADITTITIETTPSMSIELQLLDNTNAVIGSIIVAKSSEGFLVVPVSVWNSTNDIRVRQVCGVDFYSNWVLLGL